MGGRGKKSFAPIIKFFCEFLIQREKSAQEEGKKGCENPSLHPVGTDVESEKKKKKAFENDVALFHFLSNQCVAYDI